MSTTQQVESPRNPVADIPSNYSRLIARELGLVVRELPRLLRGTGLDVSQLLSEDSLYTAAQQIRILQNALDVNDHVK